MLAALLALAPQAVADEVTTLDLPRALAPGEAAYVLVTLGPVRRGQEVDVLTADGRLLGTVSPFGIPSGKPAGTYALPVPADAIHDGTISLRLTITGTGGEVRTPTAVEVTGVRLSIAGGG